jgi:hypothetical protein
MNSTVKDVMSTHVIAVRQGAPYKAGHAVPQHDTQLMVPGTRRGRR